VRRENHDLLDGIMAKHGVDFIPSIRASAQTPAIDPHAVTREEAHAYPTDFNAMQDEWIVRLSLRGEQLTLCLAWAYIPDLIREPRSDPIQQRVQEAPGVLHQIRQWLDVAA
jgi:hypothetical protein